jgi:hypothetical protein
MAHGEDLCEELAIAKGSNLDMARFWKISPWRDFWKWLMERTSVRS